MGTDLNFLTSANSVYYTGLDYQAFPFGETEKRVYMDKKKQIILLKVLTLLVDHVAIPPSFLIMALNPDPKNELFYSSLIELFQSKTLITSVHGNMSEPLDFFKYKLETSNLYEKFIFSARGHNALNFFKGIPLFHRNVNTASLTFKDLLLENLYKISKITITDTLLEKIIATIGLTERIGEVALSRTGFIKIINSLRLTHHQYRACYYAMNSAYYTSGAQTYHSDIACLAVEEFSILNHDLFSKKNNSIIVGYDPSIFYKVLMFHGITDIELFNLSPSDIDELKRDSRFIAFVSIYREFVQLLQLAKKITSNWTKDKIIKLKDEILKETEKRFHAEKIKFDKWIQGEDIGSGILTAVLGAILGFFVAGPIGAAGGTALGLLGPLLKLGNISLVEVILDTIASKNYSFVMYIEYLKEKLAKLNTEQTT